MAVGEGDHNDLTITNRDELQAFLKTRSREASISIGLRAALRVMPFISEAKDEVLFKRLTLSVYRATLVISRSSSAAALASSIAYVDIYGDLGVDADVYSYASASAAATSYAASTSFAPLGNDYAYYSGYAAAYAANAFIDPSKAWELVQADCRFLRAGEGVLLASPLWPAPLPDEAEHALEDFKARLSACGAKWRLIEHWYDQMLQDATYDPFPVQALADSPIKQ